MDMSRPTKKKVVKKNTEAWPMLGHLWGATPPELSRLKKLKTSACERATISPQCSELQRPFWTVIQPHIFTFRWKKGYCSVSRTISPRGSELRRSFWTVIKSHVFTFQPPERLWNFWQPKRTKNTRLCRCRLPDHDEGSEAPDNSSRGKSLFI